MLNTSLNFSFNYPDMLKTTTTAVEKGYLLPLSEDCILGSGIQIIEDEVSYFLKLSVDCKSGFFLNCNPQVHGGEAGKGNWGREKKEKTPASRAYESARCLLINCD